MPELYELTSEQLTSACRENAAALAETLRACFDYEGRLEPGTASPWSSDEAPLMLETSGLALVFPAGEQAFLCLIPESLILPDWYAEPGESESARLQKLATEWSQVLLPAECAPERFASPSTAHLKSLIDEALPAAEATLLEIFVFPASSAAEASGDEDALAGAGEDAEQEPGSSETGEGETASQDDPERERDAADEARPVASLYFVWPVTAPPSPEASHPASNPVSHINSSETAGEAASGAGAVPEAPAQQHASDGVLSDWLTNVPVTVSVRLAEKKVEVDQLLSMTPGSLITFSRSCEEFLELYVNNQLYARGEAVKIGEKFGLKINEVGPSPEPQRNNVILG